MPKMDPSDNYEAVRQDRNQDEAKGEFPAFEQYVTQLGSCERRIKGGKYRQESRVTDNRLLRMTGGF